MCQTETESPALLLCSDAKPSCKEGVAALPCPQRRTEERWVCAAGICHQFSAWPRGAERWLLCCLGQHSYNTAESQGKKKTGREVVTVMTALKWVKLNWRNAETESWRKYSAFSSSGILWGRPDNSLSGLRKSKAVSAVATTAAVLWQCILHKPTSSLVSGNVLHCCSYLLTPTLAHLHRLHCIFTLVDWRRMLSLP